MSKRSVSAVLRDVAERLPMSGISTERSAYICNALVYDVDDGREAQRYLRSLGMGSGSGVFGPEWRPPTRAEMQQRRAWLLFAADLWDEGVL